MREAILSADGGGSSLRIIAFDGELNLLAQAKAGCVNTNFAEERTVREEMSRAMTVIRDELGDRSIVGHYACIVGPTALYDRLSQAILGCKCTLLSEGYSHLLASSLGERGGVALSGTGSGAIWINGDRVIHQGGYGLPIGDEGSGSWIGTQAFGAAIRAMDSWGEPTTLSDALLKHLKITSKGGIINAFYGHKGSQRSLLASFVPAAAQCAESGDMIALKIFDQAGVLMAKQTAAALAKAEHEGIIEGEPEVYASGGAWKACERMYESFKTELNILRPDCKPKRAAFDPVIAGAVKYLMDNGGDAVAKLDKLKRNFAEFTVDN